MARLHLIGRNSHYLRTLIRTVQSNMSEEVWFITGASKGMGREFTEYALKNGHCVVATAPDTSKLSSLQEKYPKSLLLTKLDVTKASEIEGAVETAMEKFGRIDVLVNNAGYTVVGPVEETTTEQEHSLFDIHFFGPLNLIKQVLPHMRERKSGTIVNISSVQASDTPQGFGIYGATKAALEAMSESLSREVEQHSIRVVLVKLGAFRTEILDPKQGMETTSEETGAYDYEKTTESHTKKHRAQKGDPRRAAEALGVVLQEHRPPLRVLMGSDSYERVTKALQAELRDYEAWQELSLSTDFPEEEQK